MYFYLLTSKSASYVEFGNMLRSSVGENDKGERYFSQLKRKQILSTEDEKTEANPSNSGLKNDKIVP